MKTPRPYLLAGIALLAIVSSLINNEWFPGETLSSYFGFTIFALLGFIAISIKLIARNRTGPISFPLHAQLFSLIPLYFLIHSIFRGSINLSNYYWIAAALFLAAFVFAAQNENNLRVVLFKGIFVLAIVESMVVSLQWFTLIPSKNALFAVTGTWVNPNVTAMFLAMSLYAVFHVAVVFKRKLIAVLLVLVIFLAILFLKCRTAWLVSLVFIVFQLLPLVFRERIQRYSKRNLITAIAVAFMMASCALAFLFKGSSTDGRVRIWSNWQITFLEKPLAGHGAGMFEKAFNSSMIEADVPGNDHVNMPYNDFVELAVEGGLVALALWLSFVITLLRYCGRNKISILPIVAFLVIQLTNFGFQAIPVFALFLLYTGLPVQQVVYESDKLKKTSRASISIGLRMRAAIISALVIACIAIITQFRLASSFHKLKSLTEHESPASSIPYLADLDQTLAEFPIYHEAFGDAYLALKQFRNAKDQYLCAYDKCRYPSVIGKLGWCYQQCGMYDSSAFYFTAARRLQPHRFSPRMALLKLYELKGDTTSVQTTAMEIESMEERVPSDETRVIKAYANQLLNRRSK